MSLKVRYTCPLGHTCEKVAEDGVIERCNWYVYLDGKHPQNADKRLDGWGCAIAWGPIMEVGTQLTNRQTTQAVQQLRDTVADEDQRLSRTTAAVLAAVGDKKRLEGSG